MEHLDSIALHTISNNIPVISGAWQIIYLFILAPLLSLFIPGIRKKLKDVVKFSELNVSEEKNLLSLIQIAVENKSSEKIEKVLKEPLENLKLKIESLSTNVESIKEKIHNVELVISDVQSTNKLHDERLRTGAERFKAQDEKIIIMESTVRKIEIEIAGKLTTLTHVNDTVKEIKEMINNIKNK